MGGHLEVKLGENFEHLGGKIWVDIWMYNWVYTPEWTSEYTSEWISANLYVKIQSYREIEQ